MTYHCKSCDRELVLESGSYSFVRSLILLHLDRCDVTGRFSADQRSAEATRAADERFLVTRTRRGDGRRDDEKSESLHPR